MEKFFLVQIKQTNGNIDKGVVVKDTLDAARQSFHAYLGAYAYGNSAGTNYVACYVIDSHGLIMDATIYDRTGEEVTE